MKNSNRLILKNLFIFPPRFNSVFWSYAAIVVGLAFILSGCGTQEQEGVIRESLWKDIDLNEFQIIPYFVAVEWNKIHPSEEITYWEIHLESSNQVIGAGGNKCALAIDKVTCIRDFDAMHPSPALGPHRLFTSYNFYMWLFS